MKMMSIQLSATAVWLSLIFTLYLAPSHQGTADLLSAVSLISALAIIGLRRSGIMDGILPLAPLLVLLIYAAGFDVIIGGEYSAVYVWELLLSFLPFLLLYVVFRNRGSSQASVLVAALFIIPGLVHLAYMYLDIFLAIQQGEVPFATSSKHGFLEGIKESPRVGRRYVSMGLVNLLAGGILVVNIFTHPRVRYWAWGLSGVSVLSLALLDARAAYVSLFLGSIFLAGSLGVGRTWAAVKSVLGGSRWRKIAIVGLVVGAATLGTSAGKSRWVAMTYSFKAAAHDVFDKSSNPATRPYIDKTYWSAPIENIDKCYLEGHFRCKVDQSAYLRMAWLLEGGRSLIEHPFGIGYSDDYMGRLRGLSGNEKTYQRNDSFLIENIVSFGVMGILVYVALLWGVARTLVRAVEAKHVARVTLVVVCGILFVCAGRGLVDVLSLGLWRYVMALLGIYYGLLHSDMERVRSKWKKCKI